MAPSAICSGFGLPTEISRTNHAGPARWYFNGRESYAEYFSETHADGALDARTKELMHLALVLAFQCEPER